MTPSGRAIRGGSRCGSALRVLICLAASIAWTPEAARASECGASTEQDTIAVVAAMKDWFSALQRGDVQAASDLMAPAFYAYEAGVRLTGSALMLALEQSLAKGQRFEWSLSAFDVHVSCDQAWITYKNTGGVRTASGFTRHSWLESAALERSGTRWRVAFLHSTESAQ